MSEELQGGTCRERHDEKAVGTGSSMRRLRGGNLRDACRRKFALLDSSQ